ncbi:hypothetical protein ABLE94_02680 [Gordonia sp. VNK1]|uniref:hypothetical protein n=1 Tax=Gordonia oleivorans TaxID=3156618 RepID=UPI0032B48A4F
MTERTITPDDCQRATAAMIHWLTGDTAGVESLITEAHGADRIDAFVLALLTVASAAPGARDPKDTTRPNADWVEHLRSVALKLASDTD